MKHAKEAEYPIDKEAEKVNRRIDKSRALPDEIKELFRQFKPYKDGNYIIWLLNKFRNSVHTELINVGISGNRIKFPLVHHGSRVQIITSNTRENKIEMIVTRKLFKSTPDQHVSDPPEIDPVISFIDGDAPQGKWVTTILSKAHHEAKRIVRAIEETCQQHWPDKMT
jgi:hypothetical protein